MSLSLSEQQYRLLDEIEQAFSGVELGAGVGLREASALDGYGDARGARLDDEKLDWHKLLDDEEFYRMTSVLSFFDAEGMRFHLPAYLSVAVRTPESDLGDSLIFALCAKLCGGPKAYSQERFRMLNSDQISVVVKVLEYLRDNTSGRFKELDRAINRYWNSQREG